MQYLLIEAVCAAVLLIPVIFLLDKIRFHSRKKRLWYTVFALYLAAVYYVVGLPTVQFLTFDVNLNFIPFAGMVADLKNTLLNVLLFVPLGLFLPLLWKKFRRMGATLLFGLGMTTAIELLQLLTYRATDINDIIANFAGTFLGYAIFTLIGTAAPARAPGGKRAKDLPVIFLAVGLVMFFLQPLLTTFIYKIT